MNRNHPLIARLKNGHPDRNALWIVAFTALFLLCAVLFFVVPPWVLKILFLLIAIGAAVYCWLLIQSRRITPKPAQTGSVPAPSVEEQATDTTDAENEAAETPKPEGGAEEVPPDGGEDEHQVFISEKGDKYHLDKKCVGLRFADSIETMDEAKAVSLSRKRCSKCWPKAKEE